MSSKRVANERSTTTDLYAYDKSLPMEFIMAFIYPT